MMIDTALAQLNNRPLKIPGSAAQIQGTGARLAAGGKIDQKSPLYAQCQEFESIFVKMMLKEMRKTVDKTDSLISGGFAEDIYRDMLDDEYSKTMAKTARFGLADLLYRQLS